MQTLKTLRAFVAYPDGFTRTEYAADQVITLADDAAKSYMDAGHCAPHVDEAAKAPALNPDDFKTLGELKDAVGAKTLKEVEALVEALGHEVPDKRAVAPIPVAIYETIVNKHNAAIADAKAAEEKAAADAKAAEEKAAADAKAAEEKAAADAKAAEEKAAADAKEQAESDAKAKETEAAVAEKQAADQKRIDDEKAAAHKAKADGTHEAKE